MKRTLLVRAAVVLLALAWLSPVACLAAAEPSQSWTGWVTDDSCGAKGAKAEHKACAEKCLGAGGKLVFYDTAAKKIYGLDNQTLAKEHLGHEVVVKGSLDGDAITVASISAK